MYQVQILGFEAVYPFETYAAAKAFAIETRSVAMVTHVDHSMGTTIKLALYSIQNGWRPL